MNNQIVQFSGGKSSFAAAAWLKEKYPEDNIVLMFCDTMWEDADLYRFNEEVSNKLELPLLILSRGITPAQLMVQQKFMANNRVGTCSKELKVKVAMDYLKKGISPPIEKWINKQFLKSDDFITGATIIFGIDWTEAHREIPIRKNYAPYITQFPLIEHVIEPSDYLNKYDIEEPMMYKLGFHHNNCAGKCVKGGRQHFANLRNRRSDIFMELMEQEIVISDYIRYTKQPAIKNGLRPDYMYKDVWDFVTTGEKSDKIQNILSCHKYSKKFQMGVDSKGNPINKPYTFMKKQSLADLEDKGLQMDFWDMLDIGGCGCAVDFANCSGS